MEEAIGRGITMNFVWKIRSPLEKQATSEKLGIEINITLVRTLHFFLNKNPIQGHIFPFFLLLRI